MITTPQPFELDDPELGALLQQVCRNPPLQKRPGYRHFRDWISEHGLYLGGRLVPGWGNKVDRNAPCPCGSGKKSKKCCK